MNRVTQQMKVLEYMQAGHTITSFDAFRLFKATRLPDIIFNLRHKGYDIATLKEKTKDGTVYARYELLTPATVEAQ
jgi:hypothetical protein